MSVAVAVSSDGRFVFVASEADNAVTSFSRDTTTGALTFAGSLKNGTNVAGLGGVSSLVVSPDGLRLFAASATDDAVVALGGASVGRMPWTSNYRAELTASRLGPTLALADAIRELGEGAPAFLSASAVGYYGSVPGAVLTEASPAGNTFLSLIPI